MIGPAPWCDVDGGGGGGYSWEYEQSMYRIMAGVERQVRESHCAETDHVFARVVVYRCEDQVAHALDEPCTCGRCACGLVKFDRAGLPA